jgi:hypothetical protein
MRRGGPKIGHEVGAELAAALGLQTDRLVEFTLKVKPNYLVTVDAVYLANVDDGVVNVLKKFELREAKE